MLGDPLCPIYGYSKKLFHLARGYLDARQVMVTLNLRHNGSGVPPAAPDFQ
jgi:hypothetical protein